MREVPSVALSLCGGTEVVAGGTFTLQLYELANRKQDEGGTCIRYVYSGIQASSFVLWEPVLWLDGLSCSHASVVLHTAHCARLIQWDTLRIRQAT